MNALPNDLNTAISHVMVHTDGACSGNPGPGGWGTIIQLCLGNHVVRELELSDGSPDTTNNQMELSAVIGALEHLMREGFGPDAPIHVRSDSTYVVDGIMKWLPGWKAKGWRKTDKQPVQNADLWQRIDALCGCLDVRSHHVRGHSGDRMNDRVDALARAAMEPFKVAVASRITTT